MIRRLMYAQLDPSFIDDRDYYGNKRLELAGVYLVQCDLSTPCGSASQLLCWLHMPQLGSPLFPLHTCPWLAACLLLLQRNQITGLSICTLFAIARWCCCWSCAQLAGHMSLIAARSTLPCIMWLSRPILLLAACLDCC